MVFSGFSQLGYCNVPMLKDELESITNDAVQRYGRNNLCVVAGATTEGIGVIYDIAKKWDIKTLGVVSEEVNNSSSTISKNCDEVIYIPDPSHSLKTLDHEGKSYMVYIATDNNQISRTGRFFAFGGGEVTLSEINEANALNINTNIFTNFDPCPEQANARKMKHPNIDITPVRTAYS